MACPQMGKDPSQGRPRRGGVPEPSIHRGCDGHTVPTPRPPMCSLPCRIGSGYRGARLEKVAGAGPWRHKADGHRRQTAYRGVLKWRHAVAGDTAPHDSTLWQRFPDLRTSWQDLEARMFSEHGQGNWDTQQFLQDLRAADRKLRQSARRRPHAILPPLYASDEHMRGKQKAV